MSTTTVVVTQKFPPRVVAFDGEAEQIDGGRHGLIATRASPSKMVCGVVVKENTFEFGENEFR